MATNRVPTSIDSMWGMLQPPRSPQVQNLWDMLQVRSPRRRTVPAYMSPQEEQSVLSGMGRKFLGGFGAFGAALDLPGSTVRDLLAGEPAFDQWLHPFSMENRTSGRDLLRKWDLAGKRDTWGNFLAGMGTEIALDPLLYLVPFGFTRAGATAKELGTLAEGLGAQIRAGQRGLVGLRLPFAAETSGVIGTGKTAAKVGDILHSAAETATYGTIPGTRFSPGRTLGSMWDWRVRGAMLKPVQKFGRKAAEPIEAARAVARSHAYRALNDLDGTGLLQKPEALREILEVKITGSAEDTFSKYREIMDREGIKHHNRAIRAIANLKSYIEDLIVRSQYVGKRTRNLEDQMIDYFMRHPSGMGVKQSSIRFRATDPSDFVRKEYLTKIAGGTVQGINRIGKDPIINEAIELKGFREKRLANLIAKRYQDVVPQENLEKFAHFLIMQPEEIRRAGIYGNHPIYDFLVSAVAREEGITIGDRLLTFMSRPGILSPPERALENSIKITALLKKIGLDGDSYQTAIARLSERSGKAINKRWRISEALAEDIAKYSYGFKYPDGVNEFIHYMIDNPTNLFKMSVTGIWPAFHTRNFVSAMFRNWTANMLSWDSLRMGRQIANGKIATGSSKIPLVREMLETRGLKVTDRNATAILKEAGYANKITGRYEGEAMSRVGMPTPTARQTFGEVIGDIPGQLRPQWTKLPAKYLGFGKDVSRNPLEVRGIGGLERSRFGPAAAGEDVGHFIESWVRMTPFIEQLRKAPKEIIADPDLWGQYMARSGLKVGAAQVMYSNRYYTPLEREWMQRIFPFYKFSSRQIPYVVQELLGDPGGRMAQVIKGETRLRKPDELTPDYVAQTTSIPLSTTEEGGARYLTGGGLMYEDPLSFGIPIPYIGTGLPAAGMEALSRTNPLIKAPLEMITGQSFFQKGPMGGRPIEDLDPTIGRTIANIHDLVTGERTRYARPFLDPSVEFLAANSPASRLLTTIRTAVDPRKDLKDKLINLGTGFRITDVSPSSRDAIIRERTAKLMKEMGAREFTEVWMPEDVMQWKSPEQQAKALQLKELMRLLNARQRRRAKER